MGDIAFLIGILLFFVAACWDQGLFKKQKPFVYKKHEPLTIEKDGKLFISHDYGTTWMEKVGVSK